MRSFNQDVFEVSQSNTSPHKWELKTPAGAGSHEITREPHVSEKCWLSVRARVSCLPSSGRFYQEQLKDRQPDSLLSPSCSHASRVHPEHCQTDPCGWQRRPLPLLGDRLLSHFSNTCTSSCFSCSTTNSEQTSTNIWSLIDDVWWVYDFCRCKKHLDVWTLLT